LQELQTGTKAQLTVKTEDAFLASKVLIGGGFKPTAIDGGVETTIDTTQAVPFEICRDLVNAGVRIDGFAVLRPTLEDTFVALTGEGFDVAR
jgi:ABC-2 type transport system ATP-binding protein